MSPLKAFGYIVAFGVFVYLAAVAGMLIYLAVNWLWRKAKL